MTVAVLAERRRRARNTTAMSVALAGFVVLGGWFVARTIQDSIAESVIRELGVTSARVQVIVDGRDVTLRSPAEIPNELVMSVRELSDVATVTVELAP